MHKNGANVKIGDRYGKLVIKNEIPRYVLPCGQKVRRFLCLCDCGKEHEVKFVHLKNKRISSCGCKRLIVKDTSWYTKENKYILRTYKSIKERIYDKNESSYTRNKIGISEEWLNDFNSFYNWAIENKLRRGLQIDRINPLLHYSSDNCRVITQLENANNKICTLFIDYDGERIAFMLLLRKLNLMNHQAAIRTRIKRGWNPIKAIKTPIKNGKYFKKYNDTKN